MITTAVALLALGIVLAEPASRALAVARWPSRDPAGALLLWQAIGLAGGLSLLGSGVVFGLAPLGDSLPTAVVELLREGPSRLGLAQLLVLAATAVLAVRLLGVLGLLTARTLRDRRRHRNLLDVLATPQPGAPGARVLDHPLPTAYCLPGLRAPRLVVSAGALDALPTGELAAVLAHERAHLAEHHDLVVLPFVAWAATAPFVPGMARAQAAVAALIEMRADDRARTATDVAALSGALRTVAGSTAGLTSFSAATAARLARMQRDPDPLPAAARLAVRGGALALVAIPTAGLLLA